MLNDGISEHFVVQRGANVDLLRQKRASNQNFIVRVIVRSAQNGVVAVDACHFVFVGGPLYHRTFFHKCGGGVLTRGLVVLR